MVHRKFFSLGTLEDPTISFIKNEFSDEHFLGTLIVTFVNLRLKDESTHSLFQNSELIRTSEFIDLNGLVPIDAEQFSHAVLRMVKEFI